MTKSTNGTIVPSALPATWATFVDQVALGVDPEETARSLGYANPKATANELLRVPTVRKALIEAARARLEGNVVPLAIDTIQEILADKGAPKAVRAKLALGLVDRLLPKSGLGGDGSGKRLSDMTEDELRDVVSKLQQSAPRPADMRNVTPNAQGDDPLTP